MPTGLTAAVGDGTMTEFSAFAMRCARQFGALIMMRDEPMDAPIPDEFQPSDFYRRREADARAEYQRLSLLTPDEIRAEHRAAFDTAIHDRDRWDRDRQHVVDRYTEMLAKVRAWNPPTPDHDGLKRLMIEQLEESIEVDGPVDRKYLPKIEADCTKWHADRVAQARADVERGAEEYAKDVKRARERTAWVRALRNSLRTGAA